MVNKTKMHLKALLKGMKSTITILYEDRKKIFREKFIFFKNGGHSPNQL